MFKIIIIKKFHMYDKIYEKNKTKSKAYIAPHGKVEFLLHASR